MNETGNKLNIVIEEKELRALIGSRVYSKLLGLSGKDGYSIPCKIRTDIENEIVDEVIEKLQPHINNKN